MQKSSTSMSMMTSTVEDQARTAMRKH